ncbi:MAG: fluoride efflux transporter CrcB, partial [Pirellulales bacterium]
MKALLAVAAGGAVGAVARYLVFIAAARLLGTEFPFGTLTVNVVGSFFIGVLAESLALAWTVSTETRLFLVVGMLGAFTTFSTFSLDFAFLYERGQWLLSTVYVIASVVLSIGALFAG